MGTVLHRFHALTYDFSDYVVYLFGSEAVEVSGVKGSIVPPD